MTFLSYHSQTGAIINNCLDVTGTLKQIKNGPFTKCRPNGIYLPKIRHLISVDDYKKMNITCFIKFPVLEKEVENTIHTKRVVITSDRLTD